LGETTRLRLFLLFAGVAVVFFFVRAPQMLTLDRFAFGDQGANFTVDYLAAHGLRPQVDFGYPYGLLSISIGRPLFRFFGYTTTAYELATLLTIGCIAWAFATIASCRKFGSIAIALTAVAMPLAIPAMYSNLAHCAESSLISLGLAQHARGNRANALAFATAACFAKPAIGYVYGLLLLVMIAREWKRSGASPFAMLLQTAPAIVVGIALILVMTFSFGLDSLLHTIVSIRGMEIYRTAGFGIMGVGRDFWHPPHARIGYYIGTPAGFWIVATVWILWRGAAAAIRLARIDTGDISVELVACIAAMQAAFVFVMFGNAWSWSYYSYFLVIGAALSVGSGSVAAGASAGLLALLALFAVGNSVVAAYRDYAATRVYPDTAGLRVTQAEYLEWHAALDLARGPRAVMLANNGGAALMFPQFEPPVAVYLMPANTLPADLTRVAAQLAGAAVIVRKTPDYWEKDTLSEYPELGPAMQGTRTVLDGRYFVVSERPAR
jgi:hypothetical protein